MATSGNKVLLSTQTASASASLDFTSLIDNSTYDRYVFEIFELQPATDNVSLDCRFSIDNGSSWISSNYNWGRGFVNDTGTSPAGNNSDSAIEIGDVQGNNTSEGFFGTVIYYPSSSPSTSYQRISWRYFGYNQAAKQIMFYGTGINTTTSEVDAIQFLNNSGNIASGTIKMYGIVI